MKAIKEAQSFDINDNCTTCSSMLDIGAVINESDTCLEIHFESSTQGMKSAEEVMQQAKQNFVNVKAEIDKRNDHLLLKLEFDVAVEKTLFQMQNQGI